MTKIKHLALAGVLLTLMAAPAHADGFVTPFIGYNFGGDSGNCQSLTNCQEKHTNFGVSFGAMGTILGFEEDISWANNFFGEAPGTDNSVFSAMSNVLVGVGAGPVQPYAVGGIGLIRPHASTGSLNFDNSSFGYDIGGGLNLFLAPHVGLHGDVRHLHTVQDVNIGIFTGQALEFWRGSVGVTFKF